MALAVLAVSHPGTAFAGCVWQRTAPAQTAAFTDTVALSATDAWLFDSQSDYQRWNGAAWTDWGAAPVPVTAADGDSPTDVWAVNPDTRSAHFDGVSWTKLPYHPPAGVHVYAQAVSVVSPTLAFEGGFSTGGGSQLQRWNGSRWSTFPAPSGTNRVLALSALGNRDIWAVVLLDLSSDQTLAHWDGSGWTIVHPEPAGVELQAVAARAAGDVWAVGGSFTGTPAAHTYHFDGSSWHEVPLPAPAPGVTRLYDVAAERGSPTFAVGSRGRKGAKTYILRLVNGAWVREHVDVEPPIDTNGHGLTHLSVVPGSSEAWATNDEDYVVRRGCA